MDELKPCIEGVDEAIMDENGIYHLFDKDGNFVGWSIEPSREYRVAIEHWFVKDIKEGFTDPNYDYHRFEQNDLKQIISYTVKGDKISNSYLCIGGHLPEPLVRSKEGRPEVKIEFTSLSQLNNAGVAREIARKMLEGKNLTKIIPVYSNTRELLGYTNAPKNVDLDMIEITEHKSKEVKEMIAKGEFDCFQLNVSNAPVKVGEQPHYTVTVLKK